MPTLLLACDCPLGPVPRLCLGAPWELYGGICGTGGDSGLPDGLWRQWLEESQMQAGGRQGGRPRRACWSPVPKGQEGLGPGARSTGLVWLGTQTHCSLGRATWWGLRGFPRAPVPGR